MNIHNEFEEFLRLLNEENVEFVIVGGYAVAFHGYARATNDIDLFFRNTGENIRKLCRALNRFDIPTGESSVRDFAEPGIIIRIGMPPTRIELINTISGLTFDEVWTRRTTALYGNTAVSYISFQDLLVNKKASGRPKDIADFDELGGNRTA